MFNIKTNYKSNFNSSNYHILLLENKEHFSIDFVKYGSSKYSILFVSPYQNVEWLSKNNTKITQIYFHADFYCIEYHKKEVACNGILFNNIYLTPFVVLNRYIYEEIESIVDKMRNEMQSDNPFSESIIKTYLQLIFAICSKEKSTTLEHSLLNKSIDKSIFEFPAILDQHFIKEKKVSFYAEYLHLSISSFSKKIKQQFGKTPSQLIQERTILEAKKLLHLTKKSIKEIAFELHFEDEFYFSRYFKKNVDVSPSLYRKKVGISIVAK